MKEKSTIVVKTIGFQKHWRYLLFCGDISKKLIPKGYILNSYEKIL